MTKKISKEELDALIALATQPSDKEDTGPVPDITRDYQEFVDEINMVPGLDWISTRLIWDYYYDWTKTMPVKIPFQEWMGRHFERVSGTSATGTFFLIDEASLKITKDEMKRRIGLRLHESTKIKRKKQS